MATREDEAWAVERVRDYLRYDLREEQTLVEAVEIERATGMGRHAVETAMGKLERQLGDRLTRQERAGELRWRVET